MSARATGWRPQRGGWNDSTAVVNAVTDASGNTYTLAIGPTALKGIATQSIYCQEHCIGRRGCEHRYCEVLGGGGLPRHFGFLSTAAEIRTIQWMSARQRVGRVRPAKSGSVTNHKRS
jgi:hypothetical protein